MFSNNYIIDNLNILIYITFMVGQLLDKELQAFDARKSELIGDHKGKFALFKDEKEVGIFENRIDAIQEGYQKFGNAPFLVKQILEFDQTQNFLSNHISI